MPQLQELTCFCYHQVHSCTGTKLKGIHYSFFLCIRLRGHVKLAAFKQKAKMSFQQSGVTFLIYFLSPSFSYSLIVFLISLFLCGDADHDHWRDRLLSLPCDYFFPTGHIPMQLFLTPKKLLWACKYKKNTRQSPVLLLV